MEIILNQLLVVRLIIEHTPFRLDKILVVFIENICDKELIHV